MQSPKDPCCDEFLSVADASPLLSYFSNDASACRRSEFATAGTGSLILPVDELKIARISSLTLTASTCSGHPVLAEQNPAIAFAQSTTAAGVKNASSLRASASICTLAHNADTPPKSQNFFASADALLLTTAAKRVKSAIVNSRARSRSINRKAIHRASAAPTSAHLGTASRVSAASPSLDNRASTPNINATVSRLNPISLPSLLCDTKLLLLLPLSATSARFATSAVVDALSASLFAFTPLARYKYNAA